MGTQIKILHVIDKFSMDGTNPSSCSRLFAEWIPRHEASRFRVEVAGLRPPDPASKFLQQHDIRVHHIDEGKISPKIITAIEKIVVTGEFDILHLHGYSSANFGRLAAKRAKIRSIVHEHAILKVQPHQYLADWLLRGKNDVGVAVSRAVKEFMIKGRSVSADKIRVIWNGVRLQDFQNIPAEKINAFRAKHKIPAGKRIVGTVTRLREEKGNAFLIEAAASVCKSFDDVMFVLVGDGQDREKLESQARDLGVSGKVVFTGFEAEIAPALGAMDVVAIPSLREGFGLAMVEAMAAGKPVIASRVGGMLEIAEHEKTALFVPPANGKTLADALSRLLRDDKLVGKIRKNAASRSLDFSIEKNVAALEELYQELAG